MSSKPLITKFSISITYIIICIVLVLCINKSTVLANSNAINHTWADTSLYQNEANALSNSIAPSKTLYFASDGDDKNSGLDPQHPKLKPTDYLRNGNVTLLFKSGDVIPLKYTMGIGSNVIISTYGGNQRAVLSWVPINSAPFQPYDAKQHIYSAKIDHYTSSHIKVSWIKIQDIGTIDWQKVFSYSELQHNMDFYSDKEQEILYVKSDTDLTDKYFAFASNSGGFTIRNCSNCLIENVEIVGGGTGINIKNSSNVVVRNCYVHHTGGIESVSSTGTNFRYGNGINAWTDNDHNIYIYNNYVSDVFDAGISPQISSQGGTQPSDSIYIFDNYVDRCMYSIEFFEHNRNKNIPVSNVVIANNILTNAMDITGGYRVATYGYSSYFCNWSSNSPETRFKIANNLGYGTYNYAFAFYQKSPEGVNSIDNNSLYVIAKKNVKDCIKNYNYYSGSDSQIIPVNAESPSILSQIEVLTSKYDKDNLCFSYLNEAFDKLSKSNVKDENILNDYSSASIRTYSGCVSTIEGGNYITTSPYSPCLYSTSDINISNANLVSDMSEVVCIDGFNSVNLLNCNLSSNNTQLTGNNAYLNSVLIFQSTENGNTSGCSTINMTACSLTSESGHVFHVTNTNAIISLNNVTIINEDPNNILISVCNNALTDTKNIATVNTANQVLDGKILVGNNSTLNLNLKNGSKFTGSISGNITSVRGITVSTQTGKVNVTIDKTSKWILTEDTYISSLDGDLSNMISNGHSLFINGVQIVK